MDAHTYVMTFRADQARRAVETERRRQISERRAQDGLPAETSRFGAGRRGVAKTRRH